MPAVRLLADVATLEKSHDMHAAAVKASQNLASITMGPDFQLTP